MFVIDALQGMMVGFGWVLESPSTMLLIAGGLLLLVAVILIVLFKIRGS